MVIAALLGAALAAPVRCDPDQAYSLLTEARIEERRAPISHPELVPGLALASARTTPILREALTLLCRGDADLSLVPADSWEDREWSAHTFLLTRTDTRGCVLETRTVAISVGISEGEPSYDLRDALPPTPTMTPLGTCDASPTWTEEALIGGEGSPIRLVLHTEHAAEGVTAARVLARRATPAGWKDEVITDPAPPRLLDPAVGGPRMALTETGERWIVQSHDRRVDGSGCAAVPGQVVWRPTEDGWVRTDGLEALQLLASRGLWRYAGEDGWLGVVAQDDEEDKALVEARIRRLARRNAGETLHMLRSSWFPELNPSFVIAVLGPFPTEDQAREALRAYRGGSRRYVKRAWAAVDPCAPEGADPS